MNAKQRAKQRKYNRTWYLKHPGRRAQITSEVRRRKRDWIDRYKAERGCCHCPENDPVCLHFHHRDPSTKSFEIADGVSQSYNNARLLTEIAKCDIVCANCHLKIHDRLRKCARKDLNFHLSR